MEELKPFYSKLEGEDFITNRYLDGDINALYLVEIERLEETNLDLAILLNREREAIQFVKTSEEGLRPKMTGTGKNADGKEIPIEWPDKRNFLLKDYEHIKSRYENTENQFLKMEFGLFLYYSGYLKNNSELINLLNLLKDLSEDYLRKSKTINKNFYLLNYEQTLRHLLNIASKRRKNNKDINSLLKSVCNKVYQEHLQWDLSYDNSMRFILDSTRVIKDYFSEFKEFELTKILDTNWKAANVESEKYILGAIYIADISNELAKRIDNQQHSWKHFTAQQYEKMALESEKSHGLAEVTFLDKALRIYKELNLKEDIERVSKHYQKSREQQELNELNHRLPEDASKRIYENIKRLVAESSPQELVLNLCFTPMFGTVEQVRMLSDEFSKQSSIMNIIPISIQDKFGNTVEKFDSSEEIQKFKFLQAYGNNFQLGYQILIQLIIEAIKVDKLDSNAVIKFLENTWVGKGGTRIINGKERKISHIELLKPGIGLLFEELEKWKQDNSYEPNFICATDSLTLKIEYLLREYCLKIGLVTFKQRKDKPGVVMEKLLDDVIRDLKDYLDENDYYFIKHLMVEKAGENLRNRIAHGLLDNIEYGVQYPFLILAAILKLSNYSFNKAS